MRLQQSTATILAGSNGLPHPQALPRHQRWRTNIRIRFLQFCTIKLSLMQNLAAHAHAHTILTSLSASSLRSVLHDQHGPRGDHQGERAASDCVRYLWTAGLRSTRTPLFSQTPRRASAFIWPSISSVPDRHCILLDRVGCSLLILSPSAAANRSRIF